MEARITDHIWTIEEMLDKVSSQNAKSPIHGRAFRQILNCRAHSPTVALKCAPWQCSYGKRAGHLQGVLSSLD